LEENQQIRSPFIKITNAQKICIQITIAQSDTTLKLKDYKGRVIFVEKLKSHKWETKKIVTQLLPVGDYQITIEGGSFSIGEITFCNPVEGNFIMKLIVQ